MTRLQITSGPSGTRLVMVKTDSSKLALCPPPGDCPHCVMGTFPQVFRIQFGGTLTGNCGGVANGCGDLIGPLWDYVHIGGASCIWRYTWPNSCWIEQQVELIDLGGSIWLELTLLQPGITTGVVYRSNLSLGTSPVDCCASGIATWNRWIGNPINLICSGYNALTIGFEGRICGAAGASAPSRLRAPQPPAELDAEF